MKAKISIKLVKPTRFGRNLLVERIEAKKDDIVKEVNNFIFNRVNKHGFIPVESFTVEIFNYKNIVVNKWVYKPTYR